MLWFKIKLSSVVVLTAKLLKVGRIHAEKEIVREDRIIVLQGSCYLSLGFALDINGLGFQGIFYGRAEKLQFLYSEMPRRHQ